jgi:hypothetical protein
MTKVAEKLIEKYLRKPVNEAAFTITDMEDWLKEEKAEAKIVYTGNQWTCIITASHGHYTGSGKDLMTAVQKAMVEVEK